MNDLLYNVFNQTNEIDFMTPSSSNILGKRVNQIDSPYQPRQFMRVEEGLPTDEVIRNYIGLYGIRSTGQGIGNSVENLKERVKELGIPAKNFSILPIALQEFLLQTAFESGGFFKNDFISPNSFGSDGAVSISKEPQLYKIFNDLVFSDRGKETFNRILVQFKNSFNKIETKNQLNFLSKLNQSLRVDFLFLLIKESNELSEQNQNFLEKFFQNCCISCMNEYFFKISDVKFLLDRLSEKESLGHFFNSSFLKTKNIYIKKPYERCYLFEHLLKMGYESPDFVDALLEKRIEQDEGVDISDAAKKAQVIMTNVSFEKNTNRLKCFHAILEDYLETMEKKDFNHQFKNGNTLLHQAASYLNWLDFLPSIIKRAPYAAYSVKNDSGLTFVDVLRKIQKRKNTKSQTCDKIGDMIKEIGSNIEEVDQICQLLDRSEEDSFEEFFNEINL